jgi:hypothetical protein
MLEANLTFFKLRKETVKILSNTRSPTIVDLCRKAVPKFPSYSETAEENRIINRAIVITMSLTGDKLLNLIKFIKENNKKAAHTIFSSPAMDKKNDPRSIIGKGRNKKADKRYGICERLHPIMATLLISVTQLLGAKAEFASCLF